MRKIFLTALGSAAILLSVGQIASAKDQHHARKAEQHSTNFTDKDTRGANRQYRVVPQRPSLDSARYSGGFSAPAGR